MGVFKKILLDQQTKQMQRGEADLPFAMSVYSSKAEGYEEMFFPLYVTHQDDGVVLEMHRIESAKILKRMKKQLRKNILALRKAGVEVHLEEGTVIATVARAFDQMGTLTDEKIADMVSEDYAKIKAALNLLSVERY